MNIVQYLNRINYSGKPKKDLSSLIELHRSHIYNVPFENLNVQHNVMVRLEKNYLFKKVVGNLRGGFCYELNYLFCLLLLELEFDVDIISAQIFNEGELGPEFDHMALIIKFDGKNWLADVGFGDLFIIPLDINYTQAQHDGRNYFKINNLDKKTFVLSMSKNGLDYEKKYLFKTDKKIIDDFLEQCLFKQSSPSSYFVKNKVVTLPIKNGRKTIFNSKYIIKNRDVKSESIIKTQSEEDQILEECFNIKINKYSD